MHLDPLFVSRLQFVWVSVAFGMGVVSGIVMPLQFGTNWSRFSDATAIVIAPLLGYEGLTAFFLEATFLGILLFGRKLVPRWVHFVATLAVAAGTLSSSFWILAANSWMQTPAGYVIEDGRFFPADWWQVIFNPFVDPARPYGDGVLHHDGLPTVGYCGLDGPLRQLRGRGSDASARQPRP